MRHDQTGQGARLSSLLTPTFSLAIFLAWGATIPGTASAATPMAPKRIADTGAIVYCSDMTGPLLEFLDENTKPVGSDIDIGNEIAKRFGVKVEWKNIPFKGLV